jgi:hypothetical protein
MELDGFIKVRRDTPLPKSVSKADGETVERPPSIRMTRGPKEQCSPIKLDGLVKVRWDALLRESFSKAEGEIAERVWSIGMTGGKKE